MAVFRQKLSQFEQEASGKPGPFQRSQSLNVNAPEYTPPAAIEVVNKNAILFDV